MASKVIKIKIGTDVHQMVDNKGDSVSSIIKFRSKHSRGKQASSEGAVVFSGSNIEVFTVRNKVFVVSFFRNIAFWEILSAKVLKIF